MAANQGARIFCAELQILIREHGTTTTIELEGEWDLASQKASLAAIDQALARRPECLLLDLSEVSFIDSSAIHAVVSTSRRCAELDTRLVIVPGPRAVRRVFDLCGLTERLILLDGQPHGAAPGAALGDAGGGRSSRRPER